MGSANRFKSLEYLQGLTLEKYVGREDILNNPDARAGIETIDALLKLYKLAPVDRVRPAPEPLKKSLLTRADADKEQVSLFIEALESADRERVTQTSKALFGMATDSYQELSGVISVVLATNLGEFLSKESQRLNEALDATKEKLQTVEGAVEYVKKRQVQVDTLLEAMQEAAAEGGVTKQSEFFKEAANNHEQQAKKWACLTTIAVLVLIAVAVGSMGSHQWSLLKTDKMHEVIQIVSGKVALLSALAFTVFFSSKNYLSHRHNVVVNTHRKNALQTYKALVEAAANKGAKDVILNYAASSIFLPQDTGYLNKNDSSANATLEILPKTGLRLE